MIIKIRTPDTAAQIAAAKALREKAYREESDPIMFKWQRGEVEKSEWTQKVDEIRARYPYPSDDAE